MHDHGNCGHAAYMILMKYDDLIEQNIEDY